MVRCPKKWVIYFSHYVASTQKELQNLMDNLNKVTKKYGMKINVKKTKVMCHRKPQVKNSS